VTNSNYTNISNLKMHNYHNITINGGTDVNVSYIDYMSSSTAVSLYGGSSNDVGGIYVNSSSTSPAVYYYNTSGDVRGIEISGYDFAVWATSNASINVSMNSMFCDNMLDLYANSGGYIYAPNNTMSAPWPQSIGGNVSGYSSYVCSKQLSKSDLLADGIEDNPLPEEINFLNAEYAELLKRITDENEDKSPSVLLGYKPEFDALIKDYKALLTVNSNPIETTAILSKIEKCYYATESQNEFEAYINTLLREKSSPYIERYFVNLNLNNEKYKEAIEVCEKVLSSKEINEALTCEMLYEEALIYKYSLSNTAKANELFTKLVKDYPDNGLFSFAARELEQEGLEVPKAENSNTNQEEVIAKVFSVESYPNPFNPSTTISYTLPSEADVKIAIYDIMGRIVKTLASESKPIGSYQVTWDGTNSNGIKVSSGIYLYRFEAVTLENNQHFTKSAKLMLIK
jgi:tetratricopeptide (TPR) repeat protein